MELTSERQLADLESREGEALAMTLRPSRNRGVLAILFSNISLSRTFTGAYGDYSVIDIRNLTADEIASHTMPTKLDIEDTLTRHYSQLTVSSIQMSYITPIADVSDTFFDETLLWRDIRQLKPNGTHACEHKGTCNCRFSRKKW